jgi:hypothetical protein
MEIEPRSNHTMPACGRNQTTQYCTRVCALLHACGACALVQVAYHGFPGTMGAEFIHYLAVDPVRACMRRGCMRACLQTWKNLFKGVFLRH